MNVERMKITANCIPLFERWLLSEDKKYIIHICPAMVRRNVEHDYGWYGVNKISRDKCAECQTEIPAQVQMVANLNVLDHGDSS